MKRQILAVAITGLMAFGGTAAMSFAGPGPNGSNEHGLCTAYFNGQKNGHAKQDEQPGPFAALEQTAEESHPNNGDDGDDTNDVRGADAVYWYCAVENDFGISGNPDDNGRWTCVDDPEAENDYCDENGGKSNENGRTKGGGN